MCSSDLFTWHQSLVVATDVTTDPMAFGEEALRQQRPQPIMSPLALESGQPLQDETLQHQARVEGQGDTFRLCEFRYRHGGAHDKGQCPDYSTRVAKGQIKGRLCLFGLAVTASQCHLSRGSDRRPSASVKAPGRSVMTVGAWGARRAPRSTSSGMSPMASPA